MSQLDWHNAMAPIRDNIPDGAFNRWFKPLKLVHCDNHRVVLGVPNRFHEEWLRKKFQTELDSIRTHYGDGLQLEFELVIEENVEASHSQPTKKPTIIANSPAPHSAPGNFEPEDSRTSPRLRIVNPDNPEAELPHVDPPMLPCLEDRFIELGFNRIAIECARMVVAGNRTVNPLVIYGGVGMGKTHLLAEIGRRIYGEDPNLRVRYINGETFTSEVVQSIQTNSNPAFKRKYREQTDVLLFDDVQHLTKRKRSQEELLHIFNELIIRGSRVVFATSQHPHELEQFCSHLQSRLVSCVMAEIRDPSYEERVELLGRKAAESRITIETAAVRALAGRGQKDVRELIGSLIHLNVQAKLEDRVVDSAYLGEQKASSWNQENAQSVSLDDIVAMVETNYSVSKTDLCSKSRKGNVNWARQVAMYLARHYTVLSLEQIGKHFGRDHATVIHAFGKVKESIENNPHRRYEVEFLKDKIASRIGADAD